MEMFFVVPEGAVRRQRQGGFQLPVPRARSSGAMQDGVFERFSVRTAAGKRGVGVFRPPGGVGGKVALVGPHLMEASCNELVQAHKGVGVEAAGVSVVVGGGVEGVPFTYHEELGADLQGLVSARHKEGGGIFSPGGSGIFNTKGKRERRSLRGIVWWAIASIGRCLRIGGEGTGVRQFSGR